MAMTCIFGHMMSEKTSISDDVLPSGFTRYDYLEKRDDGVYVDTGLVIGDKYQVLMDVQFPSSVSNDTWFVGTWSGSPSPARDFLIGYYQGMRAQCGLDDQINYSTTFSNDRKRHILGVLKDRFVWDDVEQSTYPDWNNLPPIADGQNLVLFKSHHTDNGGKRRIFSAKIWDMSDNLLFDLVPCTDLNGTACFYNIVNGTALYPSGDNGYGCLYAGNEEQSSGGGDSENAVFVYYCTYDEYGSCCYENTLQQCGTYSGSIEDGSMSFSIEGEYGSFSFSASKVDYGWGEHWEIESSESEFYIWSTSEEGIFGCYSYPYEVEFYFGIAP